MTKPKRPAKKSVRVKRIDRNNFDAGRVLDMIVAHTANERRIDPDEMLRLLEEACQAYLMLRDIATYVMFAVEDCQSVATKIKEHL